MIEKEKNKPRSRISVLCTECKRRKVKCDRRLPCLACVRHHASKRCGYFDDQIVTPNATFSGSISVPSAFAHQYSQSHWPSTPPSAPSAQEQHHISTLQEPANPIDIRGAHGRLSRSADLRSPKKHAGVLHQPHNLQFAERVPSVPPSVLNNQVTSPPGPPPPGVFYPIEAPYQTHIAHVAHEAHAPHASHVPQAPYHPHATYQSQAPQAPHTAYQRPGHSYYPALPSAFPHTPPPLDQVPYAPATNVNHGSNFAPSGVDGARLLCNPPGISSRFQAGPEGIEKLPDISTVRRDFAEGQQRLENTADNINIPAKLPGRGSEVPAIGPANHALTPQHLAPPSRNSSVPSLLNNDIPYFSLPRSTWIGENPYDTLDPNETFDLFGGYNLIYTGTNGSCINHGPFSWYSYIHKDIALKSICLAFKIVSEKERVAKSKDSTLSKIPKQESVRLKASFPLSSLNADFKKRLLSLGLTFYEGEVDLTISLTDRIKLMLPSKKAVSFFVSHFFESVYPYVPIIDEKYFRKHIQRILGPFTDIEEPYTEIHVTKRYDYANLGILLLLLRITHLSALSNDNSVNESIIANDSPSVSEKTRFILNNPINIDVMHCAQLCLNQYTLYQRTNLTVLQCAVMIRAYLNIAPESGDAADGHEDNSFNVTCIQIAYCMGLNRDPSSIHDHTPNVACDHLRRKLWYFIKFLDTRLAYHFGSSMMVDSESYNTKVPFYSPGCSNVADESLEKAVCNGMLVVETLSDKVRVILVKSTSLKSLFQVRELTALVSDFEHAVNDELGTLSHLMSWPSDSPVSSYRKVYLVRLYLILNSLILAIFYHLFLNYEKAKKFDLSFFYLRKFVSISCGEFLIHVIDLMQKGKNFQLDSCVPGLTLNPPLVFMIQRTNHVNLRIVVQLNCAILKMERDQETQSNDVEARSNLQYKLARVRKLVSILEGFVKYCNCCLLKLGHRFFFSWKLSKIHSSLLNFATSESLPEYCLEEESKFLPLTDLQITELLGMVEKTWSKIKQKLPREITECQLLIETKPEAGKSHQPHLATSLPSPKGEVRPSRMYPLINSLVNDNYPIGGSPGYTAELSDSLLPIDLVNLDLGNIEDIDNLWLRIGHRDETSGLWQMVNSAKGEYAGDQEVVEQANFRDMEIGPTANGHYWDQEPPASFLEGQSGSTIQEGAAQSYTQPYR